MAFMGIAETAIDLRSQKRRAGGPSAFHNGHVRARPTARPTTRAPLRRLEPAACLSGRALARSLLNEYHRHGNLAARDRLIRQYLPLVRRVARGYAGRGEPYEDLVQVGSIGLINAIDRFELERGVDLTAYAIPSIVGEIKRHLRDRASPIRAPRRLHELSISTTTWAAELASELERPATVAEIARQAGLREDDVLEALAFERSQQPVSIFEANGNGDGPLDRNGAVESGYETGEDRATLARGFRVLDQRERRLLHLAFFRGMSQSQIAREVGISQIHVSRLTRRALEKLRAEMGSPA
jgi:RNA polymerase sigma-B factor